ncbi:MAG: T9SS type A sorting domain-containing protein [Saprospiraceae bacterium]|nr:T9SS type A sorting domain-containing protein [Saprospiraceae bacterium]
MLTKILLLTTLALLTITSISAQIQGNNSTQLRPWEVSAEMQAAKNAITLDDNPSLNSSSIVSCQTLEPFCTQQGAFFTINSNANSGNADTTNPGNDYGCLMSTPNPAWYYISIGTSGSIDLEMIAVTDVDYIIWGPFNSVTDAQNACGTYNSSNTVSCSFSVASIEYPFIPSGQAGEVYVLLVTNFDNQTQNITLTQIGGTGSISCDSLNQISGTVYNDHNSNCVADAGEPGMEGLIVRTQNSYSVTDSAGNYGIITNTGTYDVQTIVPNYLSHLITPTCNTSHTVTFSGLGYNTTGINFYTEVLECPYLTVDVMSDRRRRCFNNNTVVQYCNEGFADTNNVSVFVNFPQYLHLVSADHPYTVDTAGTYEFFIGNLAAGECGTIHIIDSVACDTGIMGLVQCTQAWITPPNSCVDDTIPTSGVWDQSSISVTGICFGDSVIRFIITNVGDSLDGDMDGPSEYRIYIDGLLVYTGTFQISEGQDLFIEIPATGGIVRLEADQRPGHPGNSHPNHVIQSCGDSSNQANLNDWLAFNAQGSDDGEVTIEEDCLPILDSYDPNDKQVSPGGAGPQHIVAPGTLLDYTIRFQNTGNAPAFTVVVKDTLSQDLDLSSLILGATSHDMKFSIENTANNEAVLVFTFDDINLIDSLSDPVASIGFLKFKIAPRATVPLGTVIQNRAGIYFDFNEPIITNYAWITIDVLPTGTPIDVSIISSIEALSDNTLGVTAYPNPTTGALNLDFGSVLNEADIQVVNLNGQVLMSQHINNQELTQLDLSSLTTGMYLVQVVSAERSAILKITVK